MTKAVDMTGARFGRLTGLGRRGSTASGLAVWLWACDCGATKEMPGDRVRSGQAVSCGCFQVESRIKHGQRCERTYQAWIGMKSRVAGNSPSAVTCYVERGITIHPDWANNFERFLADLGECPPGMTLERINNDSGYAPGNCRWATRLEQAVNTRRTHHVQISGESMCLKHACRRVGLHYRTALKRMQRGMTAQQAVST